MKKTITVIALIIWVAGCTSRQETAPLRGIHFRDLPVEKIFKLAQRQHKQVFLDFYSDT